MSEDDNRPSDSDNPEIPVVPERRMVIFYRTSDSSSSSSESSSDTSESSSDTSETSGVSGCSESLSDYRNYVNSVNFEDMVAELSDYGSEDEDPNAPTSQRRKQLENYRKKLVAIRKKVKKQLIIMMAPYNDDDADADPEV
uniref:Uncharacterized protein n=1 Tax=Schizaphis graminum TaxID=13262 RepID=A0A2S2PTI1_SCHGA